MMRYGAEDFNYTVVSTEEGDGDGDGGGGDASGKVGDETSKPYGGGGNKRSSSPPRRKVTATIGGDSDGDAHHHIGGEEGGAALAQHAPSQDCPPLLAMDSSASSATFVHLLHDDAVVALGEYTGKLCGEEAYVRLAQTCRRARRLLLPNEDEHDDDASIMSDAEGETTTRRTNRPAVVRNVIRARVDCLGQTPKAPSTTGLCASLPQNIRTLHQLAVYELWLETPLRRDNRIPFPIGSTEITDNMRSRILAAAAILDRYPDVLARLDVHCGTVAPPGVSGWFSARRGLAVQRAICTRLHTGRESENPAIEAGRVVVAPHGKKIASAVSRLEDHPFAALAREGKGWVEVYFEVPGNSGDDDDALSLPPHPEYYNMARPLTPEELMEEEGRLGEVFGWDDEDGVDMELLDD